MERVMAQLRQAIAVEDQHIHQASRALVYCRQSGQFCGSRQEVEGQRALLVATETRNVLFLSKNFLKGYVNHYDDLNITYYFIILLKCGSTLLHTALLSTEDGIQADGAIEYNQYLKIENICSDFDCLLEVYALRSSKRYEQKRKKSGSMKGLNAAFSFSTKSPKTPKKTPSGNRILDSKFHLVGNLYLNMENVDNGIRVTIWLDLRIQQSFVGQAGWGWDSKRVAGRIRTRDPLTTVTAYQASALPMSHTDNGSLHQIEV
ncbi:unnamed protein product, partial [Mesorhabditis belari]|uniref:Anillin homology domain-containing protein n=1 Tax=Mesorhabditis belari TaxID=2138241 RepID=A0AAF3FHB1_9BILA